MTISRTTVWRALKTAGKVAPQPQKRPRSSWIRHAADRPNELWHSDVTHLLLSDGTDVDVIGWLDDHARFLLHLTAHPRVTGRVVTDTFLRSASEHGYPAATLTHNSMVYTTRLARGGRGRGDGAGNAFETLLADLGITQKNGKPFTPPHPRQDRTPLADPEAAPRHPPHNNDHRTATPPRHPPAPLQRDPPAPRTEPENTRDRLHPGPESHPATPDDPNTSRVHHDTIDRDGKITIRHSGKLLHLGTGRAHARTEIIALSHNNDATIASQATGENLADFTLNPTRSYQRKNG